jgi:hypothetical protein
MEGGWRGCLERVALSHSVNLWQVGLCERQLRLPLLGPHAFDRDLCCDTCCGQLHVRLTLVRRAGDGPEGGEAPGLRGKGPDPPIQSDVLLEWVEAGCVLHKHTATNRPICVLGCECMPCWTRDPNTRATLDVRTRETVEGYVLIGGELLNNHKAPHKSHVMSDNICGASWGTRVHEK